MIMTNVNADNEVSRSKCTNVIAQTDSHTDRHNLKHYLPSVLGANKISVQTVKLYKYRKILAICLFQFR